MSTSSGPETDDEVDYEQLAAKYAVDDDDWDESEADSAKTTPRK